MEYKRCLVLFCLDRRGQSMREQDLIAYAGRLTMDQAKFAEALQKRKYAPRVDTDLADGFQGGVTKPGKQQARK